MGYHIAKIIVVPIVLIIIFIIILRRTKNTSYILTILMLYYIKNLKIISTIVQSYVVGKSSDDKKLKLKTSELFNDIFTLKTDFENLTTKHTIFIANYPESYVEYLTIMLIPKKMSIVMRGNAIVKEFVDKPIKKCGDEHNYEKIKKQIKNSLEKNSVFGYCTKYEPHKLFKLKMRTGLLRIAKELNSTITPIVFDIIDIDVFGRIKQQNYQIYIGNSFYVSDIEKDVKTVRKLFKDKLKEFKQSKYVFT